MPNLQTTILQSQTALTNAGIDNPQLDARILIAHALSCDRMQLMMQPDRELSSDEITNIQKLINRRASREPVSRILGLREFWGLPFSLNEATLDPRPDSETLIEATLSLISKHHSNKQSTSFRRRPESSPPAITQGASLGNNRHSFANADKLDSGLRRNDVESKASNSNDKSNEELRILDLGTGTGCLLLSLLNELPHTTGVGVDISPRAIEQAMVNGEQLGLTNRANFIVSDWDEKLCEKFDIIVSNPPYIPHETIDILMPEVRNFDPRIALNGGDDGLNAYRKIAFSLRNLLNKNGFVVFEVGKGQSQIVKKLLQDAGFNDTEIFTDLNNIERCVSAKL